MSAFVLVSVLIAASAGGQDPSPPKTPDIVVILADDLGIGDPRCYNPDSKIPTPHIDRLAAEGLRFTDVHSPSAVCTPTRYGLLTGRYCWRTRLTSGVLQGYDPLLVEPERPTVASFLADRGYRTACVGKWHLGLGSRKPTDYAAPLRPGPNEVGFERFFGIPSSLDFPPYLFVRNHSAVAAPSETIARSEHRRRQGGGFWRAGAIAPGFRHVDVLPALSREAVGWIEECGGAATRRPFFLYLALSAPHTPWLPLDEFRGRSAAGHYGDFVAQVDAVVGSVLEALDRVGRSQETLIIFSSDNGAHWPRSDIEKFEHRANGPWRGQKADIHEGGHRVPFIVRWPGRVAASTTSPAIGSLTDLFATLAGVVGAELPADGAEDSFDLSPLLRGEARTIRDHLVHHSLDGLFAIRAGRWKLILGRGSGGFSAPKRVEPEPGEAAGQLYDLEADPGENDNRYLAEPAVVERLTARLQEIRRSGRSRPEGS